MNADHLRGVAVALPIAGATSLIAYYVGRRNYGLGRVFLEVTILGPALSAILLVVYALTSRAQ